MAQKKTKKRGPQQRNQSARLNNRFRVIAGSWRGRKLVFPDAPGLRPTPDRVRETLFNWLQGELRGAQCLDLFAGSGALGIEALSRGAARVSFVEQAPQVVAQLKENLALLDAQAEVYSGDGLAFLTETTAGFDIIFLDPPYRQDLLSSVLDRIRKGAILNAQGLIYLEHEPEVDIEPHLSGFEVLKSLRAGQVNGLLLKAI